MKNTHVSVSGAKIDLANKLQFLKAAIHMTYDDAEEAFASMSAEGRSAYMHGCLTLAQECIDINELIEATTGAQPRAADLVAVRSK